MDRPRSGTMSDSSYSSTAPKPLHPGQAPRGLLKEKSAGVGAGAGVPQLEQVGCSEKRRREPFDSARATPSPSLNAVRSEEHTSELQSRRDLVCRLLLEKK